MFATILLTGLLAVLTIKETEQQSINQAASIDWNQISKDDDQVFHSLKIKRDGSMQLLTHKRTLLTCKESVQHQGQAPLENFHKNRKLKQVSSEASESIDNQAILGSDNRFRVEDTQLFPFSAVGLLVFRAVSNGKRSFCTGTMISEYAMVTSAHCIWDRQFQAANDDFLFYPARNGNFKPYGSVEWADIVVPNEWSVNGTQKFDYAIIRLQEPVGEITGYLGFGFDCGYESNPTNETYGLMGYPLDKNNQLWMDTCNTEIFDPCDNNVVDPQVINHECDTLGGQSGSVLWKIVNQRAQVRGIHQGYTFQNVDYNNAIAITKEVYDFIVRNMNPKN